MSKAGRKSGATVSLTVHARDCEDCVVVPLSLVQSLEQGCADLRDEVARLRARLMKEPWCEQCGVTVRECPTCHAAFQAGDGGPTP